tara:strand:+ start:267 stop:449 length:183 start_codon:yes stop_codon:yes gene_type:complete
MAKTYRKYKEQSHRSYNSRLKKSMQEKERYSEHDLGYDYKISGKQRWKRDVSTDFDDHEF